MSIQRERYCVSLVASIATCFVGSVAIAACPPVVIDSRVPEFGSTSGYGDAGVSIEADRNVQTSYAIVAAESQGGGASLAVKYSTSSHTLLGSQYVNVITSQATMPEVAAGGATHYPWLFAWDGEFADERAAYHNALSYGFSSPEEEHLAIDTIGTTYDPSIGTFPNTAKHAVVATVVEGSVTKTVLRFFNTGDFTPFGGQQVLNTNAFLLYPPSIHGFRAGNSDLMVVAWNYGSTVRFAVYNTSGVMQGSVRSISGTATNVAVVGTADGIVVAFRRSGIIYFQTWPVTGTIPYSSQIAVSDSSLDARFPRMSTGTWNGQTYFGIGWRTMLGTNTGYPTFSLYRSLSIPTLVSGPNYTSFYPEDLLVFYSKDPHDIQVFTGCSTGIVVAVVHNADSEIVPVAERGVRRSCTLVTASGLSKLPESALLDAPADNPVNEGGIEQWRAALDGVVYSPDL